MITEIPKCACGTDMVPMRDAATIYRCIYCDTARKFRMPQDGRFQLEWERRKRLYYPEQGNKAA